MPTLNVPHREQIQSADCLAACAAMVLEYLGRTVAYSELLKQLGIGPLGAPRRNITRLAQPGLEVAYGQASLPI